MTLDTRIRRAVEETVTAGLDVDEGLAQLRRTSRNRYATKAGAVLVAAALVAAGITRFGHSPTTPEPTPAPKPKGAAMVSLRPDGVVQLSGARLGDLPADALPHGPFAFADDGRSLVYAAGVVVRRLDLHTGQTSGLALCPTARCEVAVSSDLTRYAVAENGRVVVHATDSTEQAPYPVGAPVSRLSLSPTGFVAAYTTRRGGSERLETVDPGGVTSLVRFRGGDHVASGPVWSPDGHELAFVVHQGPAGTSARLTLETVAVLGKPLTTPLRLLDICTCRGFAGGIAWSPDGTRIAVSGVDRVSVGRDVWSSSRDGNSWRREVDGATGPIAWQPADD
jgi:WD40-like Beta Propeller Repeat